MHVKNAPNGYHYIFVKYVTKKGRRIYPKNAKAFCILVRNK